MAAAWPGNIRDLQGTVRRGFAETGGLVPIDVPHLFGTPRTDGVITDGSPRDFLPWMEATHRFKLDYFRRAYLHFNGDRAQIIEALDIRNALFFDYRSQLLDQQLSTTAQQNKTAIRGWPFQAWLAGCKNPASDSAEERCALRR
jgi:DNA-binding NtrC family response regulator